MGPLLDELAKRLETAATTGLEVGPDRHPRERKPDLFPRMRRTRELQEASPERAAPESWQHRAHEDARAFSDSAV